MVGPKSGGRLVLKNCGPKNIVRSCPKTGGRCNVETSATPLVATSGDLS